MMTGKSDNVHVLQISRSDSTHNININTNINININLNINNLCWIYLFHEIQITSASTEVDRIQGLFSIQFKTCKLSIGESPLISHLAISLKLIHDRHTVF
jgi:hypothetical protein